MLALCTKGLNGELHLKFFVWWNPFPRLLAVMGLYEQTVQIALQKAQLNKANHKTERKKTDWEGSQGIQVAFGNYYTGSIFYLCQWWYSVGIFRDLGNFGRSCPVQKGSIPPKFVYLSADWLHSFPQKRLWTLFFVLCKIHSVGPVHQNSVENSQVSTTNT